jgi:hypothetical protein
MAGLTPGTQISQFEAMDVFQNGQYVKATDPSALSACTGFWIYFSKPTLVSLAPDSSNSVTCTLQQGWNMVGNPFTITAALPSSLTAYWWDPGQQKYVTVSSIPVGGSVWIYAPNTGASLTFVRAAAHVFVVTPPVTSVQVLHLGDSLTVQMKGFLMAYSVTTDPRYLTLTSSGLSVDGPFWTYRATAVGTDVIDIQPICRLFNPPCASPSYIVPVQVEA